APAAGWLSPADRSAGKMSCLLRPRPQTTDSTVKLVIQVPCLNEEETLPLVFERMPRTIPGVDSIEFVVIDDGSTDRTVQVAQQLGVHHFVRHTRNMGLGRSFHDGILKALELDADILVNTDGDNQYPSEAIPELIRPILDGSADIVIGDRQ